jgi:hypothetical protein
VKGPTIGNGKGLTVIMVVIEQPVGKVYVIMDVPGRIAVAKPDDEPIDTIAPELLVHRPPPPSVRVALWPVHRVPLTVMAPGCGLTVTIDEDMQPPDKT